MDQIQERKPSGQNPWNKTHRCPGCRKQVCWKNVWVLKPQPPGDTCMEHDLRGTPRGVVPASGLGPWGMGESCGEQALGAIPKARQAKWGKGLEEMSPAGAKPRVETCGRIRPLESIRTMKKPCGLPSF